VASETAPAVNPATERRLLDEVVSPQRSHDGFLRVYDVPGDVVSLGRFHLAPDAIDRVGAPRLCRRLSGGRVAPIGAGFVLLSLVFPHRSAIEADDPETLAPYQVLNRCVRGILEGLRIAGVDATYPGLDLVTVRGKAIAMITLSVEPSGALLFEAVIANARDFSVLPFWLDPLDPEGRVKVEMLPEERTSSLQQECGASLHPGEIAELLQRGYAERFGFEFERLKDVGPTRDAVPWNSSDAVTEDWLCQRRVAADLDRHGLVSTRLGVLEAYFSLAEQGSSIARIMLAGDIIANPGAIHRLESELSGCPTERDAIDAVVGRVFASQENFILGIGPLSTIADVIRRGLD
jgi:lipoate-protein ligase A